MEWSLALFENSSLIDSLAFFFFLSVERVNYGWLAFKLTPNYLLPSDIGGRWRVKFGAWHSFLTVATPTSWSRYQRVFFCLFFLILIHEHGGGTRDMLIPSIIVLPSYSSFFSFFRFLTNTNTHTHATVISFPYLLKTQQNEYWYVNMGGILVSRLLSLYLFSEIPRTM